MFSQIILCLIFFETLLPSFADGNGHNLESSLHSFGNDHIFHGTVSPIITTENVAIRIKHIPRKRDQFSDKANVLPAMTPSLPTNRKNSTKRNDLDAATDRKNSTGPTLESATKTTEIKHIPREKRDATLDPLMPFNFFTLHLPCEMDFLYNYSYEIPNHCRWILTQRFQSVRYYRAFMLMRAEAFFFGQYYLRLQRYELDENHKFVND